MNWWRAMGSLSLTLMMVAIAALPATRVAVAIGIAQQPGQSCPMPSDPSEAVDLSATIGEEFTVSLSSNRTTGYSWVLNQPTDDAVIELVSHVYAAPGSGGLGSGGVECWTYRAVGAGTTVIALNYVRPWEHDVAPARIADFVVTVAP